MRFLFSADDIRGKFDQRDADVAKAFIAVIPSP